MCLVCRGVATVAVAALPFTAPVTPAQVSTTTKDCGESQLYCPVATTDQLTGVVRDFPVPNIAAPTPPSQFATPPMTVKKPITSTVKYQVTTKGAITADFENFKAQVQQTYDDNRGWLRLGVQFQRVESGGQFTVVLAEASQVPTYGSICDSFYSCRVGQYVIINQDRWQGATPAWNNAGGDLRNYRHMVVNHETGHWLGHGHRNCGGAGQAAPVMQQQSIDLQGCKFNPWPLDSEIWSSTLGI